MGRWCLEGHIGFPPGEGMGNSLQCPDGTTTSVVGRAIWSRMLPWGTITVPAQIHPQPSHSRGTALPSHGTPHRPISCGMK